MNGPGVAAGPLVHGLAHDLVAPDWPPVTDAQARAVLAVYAIPGAAQATVTWRSPRPMSAAAIVRGGDVQLVLKRHDPRVRGGGSLAIEHRLGAHLRRGGVPVPRVLATPSGATVVTMAHGVHELHELAAGRDAYRDAPSWSGYRCAAHAAAAGGTLAQLHRAAGSFAAPGRPFGPLSESCALAAVADPVRAVAALAAARPGLAAGLRGRPWRDELSAALAPWAESAAALAPLRRTWGHGDWHPSNLTWSDDSPNARVAAVLDLGLANRTTPAWDLAVAIERACIDWLRADGASADLAAVDALLDGYEAVRPLTADERAALPALIPVAHVGYALSEIAYYAGVLDSPQRAQVAYRDYLIGHCRWFASPAGAALREHLRDPARRAPPAPPSPRR